MLKKLFLFLFIFLIIGAGLSYAGYRQLEKTRLERENIASNLKREDIRFTIPEGWRREEIAIKLEQENICKAADFLAVTQDSEGYLFPDTYRFFPNTPAIDVAKELERTFQDKVGDLDPTPDQLVLASIVERESIGDDDRDLVAGVYANRLKIGMKLEADPTVQYGKDTLAFEEAAESTTFTFWKPITVANYQNVISPFNTYLNEGLPSHPIANPGRKSILAAMNPAQHDYLFFVHKNGTIMMSKTLQEHRSKVTQ